jgi:microcystin-dependent protein
MSRQLRSYFFDSPTDRLKDQDVPTELTMMHLLDSVAFFIELSDTAQRTKQGLAKTTSDYRVNIRSNADDAGPTPAGATTFVRPAQIPKVLAGSGIIVTTTQRDPSAPTTGEDGRGILDYEIAFDGSSIVIPTNSMELVMDSDPISLNELDTAPTGDYAAINPTRTLVDLTQLNAPGLTYVHEAIGRIAQAYNQLADSYESLTDFIKNDRVEVGEVVLAFTPPSAWGSFWIEPRGQVLSRADYPELFAVFDITYNTGGELSTHFRLPDLSEASYIKGVLSTGTAIKDAGGISGYTLTSANIPQHNHTVNITTSMAGSHNHNFVVRDDGVDGLDNPQGSGGTGNQGTRNTSADGDHTHNVSGSTGNYGSISPTPIPITPKYLAMYLKMKIK